MREKHTSKSKDPARERLVLAGYNLIKRLGMKRSGVDRIIGDADCAKATMYSNFKSKDELVLAVLEHREEDWTRNWLENGIKRKSPNPETKLLAIFDMFDVWFQRSDFEGCLFVNILLETNYEKPIKLKNDLPVRDATIAHMHAVRTLVEDLAKQAKFDNPVAFANSWYMLMNGAIVSASAGNAQAAQEAKMLAEISLKNWPYSAAK